jgi:hypothetical protein
MFGRFNSALSWSPDNDGKLIVAGTLDNCTPGNKVRIEVTSLRQNGDSVSCNDDFTMPQAGPLEWAMDVSAPFAAGPASGSAIAVNRDQPNQSFSWSQIVTIA